MTPSVYVLVLILSGFPTGGQAAVRLGPYQSNDECVEASRWVSIRKKPETKILDAFCVPGAFSYQR